MVKITAGPDVSVPLQGTYLPYETLEQHCMTEFNRIVSVPLQGTYLPYDTMKLVKAFGKTFPSPCRGLIFLTKMLLHLKSMVKWFPSPCRGLIFLTNMVRKEEAYNHGFRPLAGDLSSLRRIFSAIRWKITVSVPLQGTYLPYPVRAIHEFPYVSTALCVGKRK